MGNEGFQGEAQAPAQPSIVQERNKAVIPNLNATIQQVSGNENEHIIGKPTGGYRCHAQRNLTLGVVGRMKSFSVDTFSPRLPLPSDMAVVFFDVFSVPCG